MSMFESNLLHNLDILIDLSYRKVPMTHILYLFLWIILPKTCGKYAKGPIPTQIRRQPLEIHMTIRVPNHRSRDLVESNTYR